MNMRGSIECEDSQWKVMIDLIDDVVLFVDDQGMIIRANKKAQELPDAEKEELINRVIQQKETDSMLNHEGKSYMIRRLLVSDRAKHSGTVVICRDVTELEKMRASYLELDAAMQSSYDGMFITDGKGIALKYNEAYNRITGIDAAEMMGLHVEELEKRFETESAVKKVLQTRDAATTIAYFKPNKKVLITANPVFGEDGEIFRVIANARDITELNVLNAQLEQARELTERYYSEILQLRSQQAKIEGVIAESQPMKKIVSTAMKVANTKAIVTITGESGVGKEVLARAIHNNSKFKNGPFVKINCGAIPDELLESELFGYERGAFTGAGKAGKPGLLEVATGGTVFLDEIGELPMNLQAKLLGVFQDLEFTRVGGVKTIAMNSRVIVATNRNLETMLGDGSFRKDLYYRLHVVTLTIPPLTQRKDDIFPLAKHFLEKINHKHEVHNTLSPQVLNAFVKYEWPGNVRELENLMERLVVLAPNEQITLDMLPDEISGETLQNDIMKSGTLSEIMDGRTLEELIDQAEKNIFQSYLNKGFSTHKIAKHLGVSQPTVFRKIRKYGLR